MIPWRGDQEQGVEDVITCQEGPGVVCEEDLGCFSSDLAHADGRADFVQGVQ